MLSAFVKKLLFARQIDIDRQLIVLDNKKVMISPKAITDLQYKDSEKIYGEIKRIFAAEAKEHKHKIGVSDKQLLDLMLNLFETYGLGQMQLLHYDHSSAVFSIMESPFVSRGKNKTCYFTAGALAGAMSVVWNKDVECVEENCMSNAGNACRFVVKR
jgi:predicted hydrocarbon binding protein